MHRRPHPPREIRVLRNATSRDGEVLDLTLDGATVESVAPAAGLAATGEDELDLAGFVLLPAPADAHAHIDKSRIWELAKPPLGGLEQAIASHHAYAARETEDGIAERARETLTEMLVHGTTAVRSHINLRHGDDPLKGVRAAIRVREELAELMDIELVTLGDEEIPDSVHEEAIALGVDLIGGAPHLESDPLGEQERLLAIAERLGVGVDLHVDEALAGETTIVEFARRVRGWGVNATAGHCVRLGTLPKDELAPIVAELLASDLGIVTNPITNLYLQGRGEPVATPRGITALRELIDAGVRLGAGADNVRDPFNPVGSCDALETVTLLVVAGHLSIEEAYALVADGSRSVMRLPAAGAFAGGAAEFLAVRGDSLDEVAATHHPERITIHRGAVVARTSYAAEIAATRIGASA